MNYLLLIAMVSRPAIEIAIISNRPDIAYSFALETERVMLTCKVFPQDCEKVYLNHKRLLELNTMRLKEDI